MARNLIFGLFLSLIIIAAFSATAKAQDAQSIIETSFNYMRGNASIATVHMIIHRPDWERAMTIKAWTKGQKQSLFRIIAPPRDNGNGTLKKGREMWIYNPKVNRVIKLPPSMMSQAWMGSDFSNNDLSKTDSIINDYTHTLTGVENIDGKKVYLIKSIPKPEAPVVWGMQIQKIREDNIILSQEFFDEDFKSVKKMTGFQIQMLGGKLFPKVWRMQKTDAKDKYTELVYNELVFKQRLEDSLFTISNLRNPGREAL
ncbi:MAG: outer membrane lipoprotein-sorting protein [Deltaproteobacteria bacterium]|jgi:outer membrane lipoprotein-sorting protein|nr:outer membrane lipoprotein-sorting protein [Deltaproteobacteria bacterium]